MVQWVELILCSSNWFVLLQILDDITLSNLDVIDFRGKLAGTLLERIDHTSTPFGKILMCSVVMV